MSTLKGVLVYHARHAEAWLLRFRVESRSTDHCAKLAFWRVTASLMHTPGASTTSAKIVGMSADLSVALVEMPDSVNPVDVNPAPSARCRVH